MDSEQNVRRVGRVEQLVGPVRVPETELMCGTGCGCPHEEWDYRGATFAMHHDEGLPITVVVLFDEDEEIEIPVVAETFEQARAQACRWIDARMQPNDGFSRSPR